MMELVKQTGRKLPLLYHTPAFMPEKNAFVNEVVLREGYTLHTYPPSAITLMKGNGKTEFVWWFSVGEGKPLFLMPDIIDPIEEGKPWVCGLKEIYGWPTAPSFNFPWDLVLLGQKSSDQSDTLGSMASYVSHDLRVNPGGPDYLFPLRHFTDEDIYQCHVKFDIPYEKRRYFPDNGKFSQFSDHTFNNDHHSACIRCMDKDEAAEVVCPLTGQKIPNISANIMYTEPGLPGYRE